MALVSFGVPVYNGADQIRECLDCLCNQTLQDIEIVVSDNASTDGTAAIVQEFAARDPRVRLVQQATNVGLMNNFKAVFESATSPYFIFRCHDDLSSLNYAEVLLEAVKRKQAELGVPTVETYRSGKLVRTRHPPEIGEDRNLSTIHRLLFQSHQAWFCGLWRTDTLRQILPKVWSEYDSPWGPDHLSLYPLLIVNKVAVASKAVYIQRITPKQGNAAYPKPPPRDMLRLRGVFFKVCREFRAERGVSGLHGAASPR